MTSGSASWRNALLVIDASAAVDLVLGRPELTVIMARRNLHVPAHFDVEVTSALRSIDRRGQTSPEVIARARSDLAAMALIRHSPHLLVDRAWELRESMSTYDATYVALAEALDCPLVTTDERLARSASALVEVQPSPLPTS